MAKKNKLPIQIFKLSVCEEDNPDHPWDEEVEMDTPETNADKIGNMIINRWNNTLRSGDKRRKLLSAEYLGQKIIRKDKTVALKKNYKLIPR